MMYLKVIALTCFPFMVTEFIAYLIGSFVSVSFNPELWTLDLRTLMPWLGMLFGIALYMKLNKENLV
jgi:hypothetical protein